LCVILGDKCIQINNTNVSNFTFHRQNTSIYSGVINKSDSGLKTFVIFFLEKIDKSNYLFKVKHKALCCSTDTLFF